MSFSVVAIAAYVAVQLGIGWAVSRRIRTEDDYLLAGRRLGYGLATFTIFATWFGAETCVGAAGEIYSNGVAGGSADPFGYAACILLMGLFFARPLWRLGVTTLADLLRLRYSVKVERFSVAIMVPASLLWAGAQIRAFGQVLATASGWSAEAAIVVAATTVVLYTVWGGLLADAVTDTVQGVVLAVGLVAVAWGVASAVGGVSAGLAAVPPERFRLVDPARPALETVEAWAIPVLGSMLSQELAQRILASRSPEVARRSSFAACAVYLGVGLLPVFVGLVGPSLVPGLEDPEQLLPTLAREVLPRAAYVLFVGALVSAILSTADSTLLVAATLVSHNVVVPLRGDVDEARKVKIARAWVVVFGAIATVLALSSEGVHSLVEQASGFGSAGFVVVVVVGLFTGFGGQWAALASLAAGIVVWCAGSYVLAWKLPYLWSLAAALAAYGVVAPFDRGRRVEGSGPGAPLPPATVEPAR